MENLAKVEGTVIYVTCRNINCEAAHGLPQEHIGAKLGQFICSHCNMSLFGPDELFTSDFLLA